MSRSKRKTPIHGWTTSESEKADKRMWHKRMRQKTREALYQGKEVMPEERDVSNPWSMAKDGKAYDPDWGERGYRGKMK